MPRPPPTRLADATPPSSLYSCCPPPCTGWKEIHLPIAHLEVRRHGHQTKFLPRCSTSSAPQGSSDRRDACHSPSSRTTRDLSRTILPSLLRLLSEQKNVTRPRALQAVTIATTHNPLTLRFARPPGKAGRSSESTYPRHANAKNASGAVSKLRVRHL